MTWMKMSLIAIALVLSACGGSTPMDSRDETADTRPIDELVARYYSTESEPGLALMVVKDGDIVFQHTRGIANLNTGDMISPQSNFRLASVTKHITALAVLMLSDWSKLDLDASLVELFPGFPAFGDTITSLMITEAKAEGKRYKLVAHAWKEDRQIKARVSPELVGKDSVLYNITGSTAIVQFESDVLGKLSFIEEDLGTRTTAYGLLTDFINAVTG